MTKQTKVEEIISELNYALALPFVTIEQKSIVRDEINRIHKKALASLAPQEPSKLETAGFELDNVIADMKLSGEFDCVSYDTVVSVRKTIADYVAWQGLTIVERSNVIKEVTDKFRVSSLTIIEVELARAIEQALKEKNT